MARKAWSSLTFSSCVPPAHLFLQAIARAWSSFHESCAIRIRRWEAMTRARDSLHMYGKQGIGRDKTPAGFLRELIGNSGLQRWLRARAALPSQPELIELAAGADPARRQGSRLPEWLELRPIEGLDSRLSAS